MSNNEGVGSLFGTDSTSDNQNRNNGVEAWRKLHSSGNKKLKKELANSSVKVNIFYSEYSESLDTGKGRDHLVEYVHKHVNGDYDISAWNNYDPVDVTELSIFLLDEIDRNGKMSGKELFNYVEEFVLEDGEPDYLEGFEF